MPATSVMSEQDTATTIAAARKVSNAFARYDRAKQRHLEYVRRNDGWTPDSIIQAVIDARHELIAAVLAAAGRE